MDILLIFSGFIFACLVALLYEYKLNQMRKEPKNRVHFYLARDKDGELWLYLGKPYRDKAEFRSLSRQTICLFYEIERFGLKSEDYNYLKWEDEPVEVFLNLED